MEVMDLKRWPFNIVQSVRVSVSKNDYRVQPVPCSRTGSLWEHWPHECPHDPEQGKRLVQILKRTTSRNGAPYAPTLHVKPSYILLWTINVWFLHRGRPPSSSLKRRNVTKSMAVFPFQKWAPVTPHPCQSNSVSSAAQLPSNSSLLYSGGKSEVF